MRFRYRSVYTLLSLAMLFGASAADAGREFFVTDRGTNKVLRYDYDTGAFLGELVGAGNPLSGDELDEPVAMQISPSGTLLVANRGNGRVVEYDIDTGEFLGDFASGLEQPTDLLVFDNEVYVSSLGPTGFDGNTVYRFNADGTPGTNIVNGAPTGRSGLAVGKDGHLYVGSFFDGAVLRYDLGTGDPVGTGTFGNLAPVGAGTGYFTFDANDDLLAVGLFSFNVAKLNGTTGATVGQFIAPEQGLFFPSDILALTSSNELLITSIGNDDPTNGLPLGFGYISKFDLTTGAILNPFFIAGTGGLQQPTSLLIRNTLAGDLDGDDFVGQDDLNLVLGLWGQNVASGNVADGNRDGFIGQDDLNVVLGSWGQGTLPTLRTSAVPEVSSLLMMSITACLVLAGGWRRLRLARAPHSV